MVKREKKQNRNNWRKVNKQWEKVTEANKFISKSERKEANKKK